MGSRRFRAELRCPRCRLHRVYCLCAEITPQTVSTRVILLMHHREWSATTNTARLVSMALTHSEIRFRGIPGEAVSQEGFDSPGAILLFPEEKAELLDGELVETLPRPITLIVPDGTWRQAAKMGRREPALRTVRRVRLPLAPSSYRLRRPSPGRLCTLEAVAHALGLLEGTAVEQELLRLFHLMVQRTLATRPPSRQPETYREAGQIDFRKREMEFLV